MCKKKKIYHVGSNLIFILFIVSLFYVTGCQSTPPGGWKIIDGSQSYATRKVVFKAGPITCNGLTGQDGLTYGFYTVGREYSTGQRSYKVEYFKFIPEGVPQISENVINLAGKDFKATALSEESYLSYLQKLAK